MEQSANADRQRLAVVLRYFGQLSTNETARAMGCSAGTVKSCLHTALRRLSDSLIEPEAFAVPEVRTKQAGTNQPITTAARTAEAAVDADGTNGAHTTADHRNAAGANAAPTTTAPAIAASRTEASTTEATVNAARGDSAKATTATETSTATGSQICSGTIADHVDEPTVSEGR